MEEDKKRAEEEGMALQSRKGKADDLTITISKSTSVSVHNVNNQSLKHTQIVASQYISYAWLESCFLGNTAATYINISWCLLCGWGQDNRVVVTKPFSGGSPAGKGTQEAGLDRGGECPPQGAGRGHRKQLVVTMAGKKVTILLCQFTFQVNEEVYSL